MNISLKGKLIYGLIESPVGKLVQDKLDWSDRRDFERKEAGENDSYYFNLANFTKSQLVELRDQLVKTPGVFTQTVGTINRWLEALDNPSNTPVTNLQNMEKVFNLLYKTLPNGWLMKREADGTLNPVCVTEFKYKSGTRDESPYFYIGTAFGYYFKKEKESREDYHTENRTEYFYKSAISDSEEYEVEFESLEEKDEEAELKPKKKAEKGILLSDVLAKRGLYIPTKQVLEEYVAQQRQFFEVAKQVGKLYTNSEYVYLITYDSWRSNYRTMASAQDDGVLNKLVVDAKLPDGVRRTVETKSFGTKSLPYHPYVVMYDITKHRSVISHVTLLKPYQYNKGILSELVLPQTKKRVLSSLIEGELDVRDVVAGKTGGIIVLCSGIPGTGKTLTAEVYSEVLEKPLYQIQSAQLGIKVEEIEKNLYDVLRRAQRWNAVLLLDECDTYVYERGTDIVQNCIVGTFLRLLEYFNGVMFMTTNRSDIVDAAIMSRVTAHIKYETPDLPEQIAIAEVLCNRYGIQFDEKAASEMFETHGGMTGRDIRNLCKLLRKYYHNQKAVRMDTESMKPLLEYIPFLNQKKVTDEKAHPVHSCSPALLQ